MRSLLKHDTICSLMYAQINQDVQCYKYDPDDEELKSDWKAVLSCKLHFCDLYLYLYC